MCRFLIVKSKKKIKPENLLKSFALVCQKSIAPDGELQKDGYGVAWNNGKFWQIKKSLTPIWENLDLFGKIPETDLFVAHARSASFVKDKNDIDFNQPFIDGAVCFVFNGMIRKVNLNLLLEGEIGSQKLFSLIKLHLKNYEISLALQKAKEFILNKAQIIEGMNIGLITRENICLVSHFTKNENYYSLYYSQNPEFTIVCSQKFGSYSWKKVDENEIS